MNDYKVDNVASAGEQIPNNVGIPEIYLDFINQEWQSKNGSVISVLLKTRGEHQWAELGNMLVKELLSFGYIGLSVDGSIPDFVGTWLKLINCEEAYGVMEMKQGYYPHPTKRDFLLSNITFCSIQSAQNLTWPKSLWTIAPSSLFNYGCDLILTAYKEDIIAKFIGVTPITVSRFAESLESAVGWIIPLDGNLGFLLGVQSGSGFGENYSLF